MKKILIILLLFYFGLFCNLSAQRITYHYDAAGNRTERVIPFMAARAMMDDDIEEEQQQELQTQQAEEIELKKYEDDLFPQKNVVIYPNPTRGQLVIEIQNYDTETLGDISIYTSNGLLLQKKEIIGSSILFDIGNQPDGMYLLNIKMDGKTSSWKILKQ